MLVLTIRNPQDIKSNTREPSHCRVHVTSSRAFHPQKANAPGEGDPDGHVTSLPKALAFVRGVIRVPVAIESARGAYLWGTMHMDVTVPNY